jgi:release factor glutamine methyltransferase
MASPPSAPADEIRSPSTGLVDGTATTNSPRLPAAPLRCFEPAQVPDVSHMRIADWADVYEPAEDTFLFLDALKAESRFLAALRPTVCLEIGCGSGVVSTYLAKLLDRLLRAPAPGRGPSASDDASAPDDPSAGQRRRDAQGPGTRGAASFAPPLVLATDINVRAAQETARRNGVHVEAVVADLVEALEPRLRGRVDVLLFNPPYVPSPSDEVGSRGIAAAWAGGHNGREVIDRALPKAAELLSPDGVFYLVVVVENRPVELAEAAARLGLSCERVRAQVARKEKLSVLKFTRAGRYVSAESALARMTRESDPRVTKAAPGGASAIRVGPPGSVRPASVRPTEAALGDSEDEDEEEFEGELEAAALLF